MLPHRHTLSKRGACGRVVATLNGCDRKLLGIPLGVAGWGERVFGHPEVRSPDGLGERVFGRGGANYQILRLTNFK